MADPAPDWFLAQWLAATKTTQAALGRRTGWDKRKTSFLVNGQQDYRRQDVNEAAAALSISPWELLLHPADAMAIRQVRAAIRLAADQRLPYNPGTAEDFPEWTSRATG
ncbi:hypothetical protein ACLBKU_11900 [Erythrobacter sp. NE805]|uniref:hypothetical protein n=1 Tax=Erythrobacter sp. NE805 TaxID=3389875 RepID=UPI00396B418F